MDEKLLDFENVCRICLLKKDQMISMFQEIAVPELISFKDMIQECASIQISNDDILPKSICVQCSTQLEQSYKLRAQCLLSEKIIRIVIEKSNIKIESEECCKDEGYSNNIDDNLNSFPMKKDETEEAEVTIIIKEENFDDSEPYDFKLFSADKNKKTSLLPFKCKFCDLKLLSKAEYIPHLEQVHLKTVYKCDKCEQIYYTADGLKRHSLIHEKRCRYCFKLFENKSHLLQHVKEHVDKSEFPCGECDKVFKSRDTRRIHRRSHSNEKNFLCTYCGRSFRDYSNLQVHIRIHSGEKPYSCDICGAKFVQWYSLKSHSITHSKEKNYECKICDKTYARRNGLTRHILTHSGVKNVVCNICDKRFLDKKDLREHQKIHIGERKHICAFCDKAFLKNDNLKVHLRTHTGDRPFVCSRCGKGFAQKHVLNSHLRTHVGSPK